MDMYGDSFTDLPEKGILSQLCNLELGREPLGFEINKRAYEHFKPRFHKKRK